MEKQILNPKEMDHYFFAEETTQNFLEFLTQEADVFAPHKKGQKSFSYQPVTQPKDVVLDYPRTIQPLKKYFLPPREVMLEYSLNKNEFQHQKIDPLKRIFFAIHSYEMQAIFRLDFSFQKGNPEWSYLTRRENAIFIGISFKPDKWHFSKSLGIDIERVEGFSLFFKEVDNGHMVYVIDEKGKELLDKFAETNTLTKGNGEFIQSAEFSTKLKLHHNRLPKVFNHIYDSSIWKEVAEKCVGCGTCNLLCPTCYCFDVRDEVELNVDDGKRERFWDGCMLNSFAEVAGGENFRDKISNRTRHRLNRKFKYLPDQSGEMHCVGCGRCTRYCPAEISIVEIANRLIDDYTSNQLKQSF